LKQDKPISTAMMNKNIRCYMTTRSRVVNYYLRYCYFLKLLQDKFQFGFRLYLLGRIGISDNSTTRNECCIVRFLQ